MNLQSASYNSFEKYFVKICYVYYTQDTRLMFDKIIYEHAAQNVKNDSHKIPIVFLNITVYRKESNRSNLSMIK